jgi:hypothetical protein
MTVHSSTVLRDQMPILGLRSVRTSSFFPRETVIQVVGAHCPDSWLRRSDSQGVCRQVASRSFGLAH